MKSVHDLTAEATWLREAPLRGKPIGMWTSLDWDDYMDRVRTLVPELVEALKLYFEQVNRDEETIGVLNVHVLALEALLARHRGLLARIEWRGTGCGEAESWPTCPCCREDVGHAPDCDLAALKVAT